MTKKQWAGAAMLACVIVPALVLGFVHEPLYMLAVGLSLVVALIVTVGIGLLLEAI
jgi:hypothetical protein